MKKFISVILVITVVLGITACGNKQNPQVITDDPLIGIWAFSDADFDYEVMKKEYEVEGMEWVEPIDEEKESGKEFYNMLMAGMYFEFKDDGTVVEGYYSPNSSMESSETLSYNDGKIIIDENTIIEFNINAKNKLEINEDGLIMRFEKISSVEEIENMDAFKRAQEMNENFMTEFSDDEIIDDVIVEDKVEDIIEEVTDEVIENSTKEDSNN